jgi:hypothetical protein
MLNIQSFGSTILLEPHSDIVVNAEIDKVRQRITRKHEKMGILCLRGGHYRLWGKWVSGLSRIGLQSTNDVRRNRTEK